MKIYYKFNGKKVEINEMILTSIITDTSIFPPVKIWVKDESNKKIGFFSKGSDGNWKFNKE